MTTKLLEKALQSAGGLEEFKQKRDQFNNDLAYFDKNQKKFLESYDENWIAVYNSKVVAYSKHYYNMLAQIEKGGFPDGQLVIKYMSKRDIIALYNIP